MRKLLVPFSLVYLLGVALRNLFFDKGILKKTNVGVPVISIGNISTGGVGKTPFIELLMGKIQTGYRVAIVSRGYARKSTGTVIVNDGSGRFAAVEDAGDESSQLSRKFPKSIIVVDEKRVRGAKKAVELGAEFILLDDGFQHRYLHRDLNLVVMSAEEVLKGDWLLPAGNRREPINSLKRSDGIVISRCADKEDLQRVSQRLLAFKKPVVGIQTRLKSFKFAFSNRPLNRQVIGDKKVIAFSGIGNPKSFEYLLKEAGINVLKHFRFPDHRWYSESDVRMITEAGRQMKAEYIVTTEKDIVRLKQKFERFLEQESVVVLEVRQEVIGGEESFDELLKRVMR